MAAAGRIRRRFGGNGFSEDELGDIINEMFRGRGGAGGAGQRERGCGCAARTCATRSPSISSMR